MNQFQQEVDSADREAEEADLAFATGQFPAYWQRTSEQARARLEAQYAEYTNSEGGNGGADSGVGTDEDSAEPD